MGGIFTVVYLLSSLFFKAHAAAVMDSYGAATTGGTNSLRNLKSRIIGGSTANTQRYPYFTLLNIFHSYSEDSWCGGTLIAPDVVLTAAHCINYEYEEADMTVDVWVNSTSREYSEYEYYRKPTKIVFHPKFESLRSGPMRVNDIGLIFLEEPVLGVPMPKMNTNYSIPSNNTIMPLTIIGLGESSAIKTSNYSDDLYMYGTYDYTYPLHLMEASIDSIPMNKCIKSYGSVNIKNSIICHSDTGLKGVCYGDSGGPLLIPGPSAKDDVQVGISSWVPGTGSCTKAGKAQGATRVSHHIRWINDQVCKYSNNKPITCPLLTAKPTQKPTKKPTRKPTIDPN